MNDPDSLDDDTETLERRMHVAASLVPIVASLYGVGVGQLSVRTRGRAHTAFARQVAMYVTHVTCGLNLTEVGRLFMRDRTTVAHACQLIETKRDEPIFDEAIGLIEAVAAERLRAAGLGIPEYSAGDGAAGGVEDSASVRNVVSAEVRDVAA